MLCLLFAWEKGEEKNYSIIIFVSVVLLKIARACSSLEIANEECESNEESSVIRTEE